MRVAVHLRAKCLACTADFFVCILSFCLLLIVHHGFFTFLCNYTKGVLIFSDRATLWSVN